MSIKNRLQKIENKMNLTSEFCACPREIVFKIIPFGARIEQTEIELCEDCRKPIPKRPTATFNIDGNANYRVIKPTVRGEENEEATVL